MKVILALCAFCVFAAAAASGQTQTPAVSGPVGPAPSPQPPPAKAPFGDPSSRTQVPPRNLSLTAFDRWVLFESPAGGFSIRFPVAPHSEPAAPVPDTPGLLHSATLLDAGAGRFFEVDYFDYQGHLAAPEAAKEVAVKAMTNYQSARGFELTERREVVDGRCHITELTMATKSGSAALFAMRIKQRILYSGDKMYLMLARSSTDAEGTGAADHFLDSFAVTGGCVPTIGTEPEAKVTKSSDEGILDPSTGWQQFDSGLGVTFLLPGKAEIENIEQSILGRDVHMKSYRTMANGATFSVEIYNAFLMPEGSDRTVRSTLLDTVTIQLRGNLGKRGFILGDCETRLFDGREGRECSVTHTSPALVGRARIFLAPNWDIVAIAMRDADAQGLSVEDRFFSSIKIDAK